MPTSAPQSKSEMPAMDEIRVFFMKKEMEKAISLDDVEAVVAAVKLVATAPIEDLKLGMNKGVPTLKFSCNGQKYKYVEEISSGFFLRKEDFRGLTCNGEKVYGTLKCSDGSLYVGEYKDGDLHGKGTFKHATGDVHEGEYKDGKRYGKGTFKYENGDVSEGEWKDGVLRGMGADSHLDGLHNFVENPFFES